MKTQSSQSGFSHTVLLLTIIVLVGAGFAGWKVYTSNKSTRVIQSLNSTSAPNTETVKQNNSIPDGWVEYKNNELGLKFAYPKDWGDVKLEDYVKKECSTQVQSSPAKVTGDLYTLKFSKNTDKIVRLISKDFSINMQLKCLMIGPYYSTDEAENFLKIGDIDFRIATDGYECGLSTYFLLGLAPLSGTRFNPAQVTLHSVQDMNALNKGGDCLPRDEYVKKTQGLLNEEDKKLMKTFKGL